MRMQVQGGCSDWQEKDVDSLTCSEAMGPILPLINKIKKDLKESLSKLLSGASNLAIDPVSHLLHELAIEYMKLLSTGANILLIRNRIELDYAQ